MTTEKAKPVKTEPTKEELEASYKKLKTTDDGLTKEIESSTKARNEVRKEMRGIMGRLTTINMNA